MINGYYYLHVNGDLIYKPGTDCVADIRESDFAKGLWPIDLECRASAWGLLVESLSAGADKDRVKELAEKWGCDDADAKYYAQYLLAGLQMDGSSWCVTPKWFENFQESEAGFGDTALEAFSDLCKQLGYKPSKMWGSSFKDLMLPKANG